MITQNPVSRVMPKFQVKYGIEIEANFSYICDTCEGTGYMICPCCNGTGEIEYECTNCDEYHYITFTCNECDYDNEIRCRDCDGSGAYQNDNYSYVNLPSEWEEDEEHCGLEFVSPIFTSLEEGENQIVKVLDEIVANGGEYNHISGSGIHIHVDIANWKKEEIGDMAGIFYDFQDRIYDVFRVTSLREHRWCAKYGQHHPDEIRRELDHYHDTSSNRYFGMNILSFEKHNTVEFRLFNGFVDDENYVLSCVQFALGFVQLAFKHIFEGVSKESTYEMIHDLLDYCKDVQRGQRTISLLDVA